MNHRLAEKIEALRKVARYIVSSDGRWLETPAGIWMRAEDVLKIVDRGLDPWEDAKAHLDHIRQMYTEIGMPGLPALRITIDPLFVRYEKGERSDELLEAIMALE